MAWDDARARAALRRLFEAGIRAADPMDCLAQHLPPPPRAGRVVVVGVGKAAAKMAFAPRTVPICPHPRRGGGSRSALVGTQRQMLPARQPRRKSSTWSLASPRRIWCFSWSRVADRRWRPCLRPVWAWPILLR